MSEDWQRAQVERIGAAIKELRGGRSAQWVSEQTSKLGVPVGRSTITDIEIGRRKYIAVHELSALAAALGVTPAALLTWGSVPDGDVELLPERTVDGLTAARWWGGESLFQAIEAAQGLPHDSRVGELFTAARRREQLQLTLAGYGVGGQTTPPDPALVPRVRKLLTGTLKQIRELGGVIKGDGDATG